MERTFGAESVSGSDSFFDEALASLDVSVQVAENKRSPVVIMMIVCVTHGEVWNSVDAHSTRVVN